MQQKYAPSDAQSRYMTVRFPIGSILTHYYTAIAPPLLYGPANLDPTRALWYVKAVYPEQDQQAGATPSGTGPFTITFDILPPEAITLPRDILDDGNIQIPMNGMDFYFFGINYNTETYKIYWNSNNVMSFDMWPDETVVSFSRNLVPAVLLGNYDRLLKSFSSLTRKGPKVSVTEILVEFFNYYTDDTETAQTYTWIIRLIKENIGEKRQYIEVSTGPDVLPDSGYSSARSNYPTGRGVDSRNRPIDQSKTSPFNITNGTTFLNPCGSTFSTAAPPANSSFVFWSDSTGTNWSFVDKAHVRLVAS
jgi:hypothetical protein